MMITPEVDYLESSGTLIAECTSCHSLMGFTDVTDLEHGLSKLKAQGWIWGVYRAFGEDETRPPYLICSVCVVKIKPVQQEEV